MDVLEAIQTRRSVRAYKNKPVEWEKITHIIDAGRYAPSAGNVQDRKFILVTEQDTKNKLMEVSIDQDWISSAPVVIVVCGEPFKQEKMYSAKGKQLYTIQDSAASVQNMLLAAHAQGLGACWIGAFEESGVKRILSIPEDVLPQALITLGYPDEKPKEPIRLMLVDMTYIEKWGNKIKDVTAFMQQYYKKTQAWAEKGKKLLSMIQKKAKR